MKRFSTKVNGYDKDEVNAFVNEVAKNYEEMLNSLKTRDHENEILKQKIEHFEQMESSLNKALLVAEEASHQIKKIAKDEYNMIIEDAKKNASRIVNNALLKAERAEDTLENLKRNIIMYKRRVRQSLEDQMELLDRIDEDHL